MALVVALVALVLGAVALGEALDRKSTTQPPTHARRSGIHHKRQHLKRQRHHAPAPTTTTSST